MCSFKFCLIVFLFFPYPATSLFQNHLPHCFNLASANTCPPPNSFPLHHFPANQRIQVMQGAPANQRWGLLRRRLQTHTKPQTHSCTQDVLTKLKTSICYRVRQYHLCPYRNQHNEEHNSKGQPCFSFHSLDHVNSVGCYIM